MRCIAGALFAVTVGTTGVMAFDCPMGEQGPFEVSNWNAQTADSGTRIELTLKNVSGGQIGGAFGRLFIAPEAESAGIIAIQEPLETEEEVTIVNIVTTTYGTEFDFEAAASRPAEIVACLTSVELSGN